MSLQLQKQRKKTEHQKGVLMASFQSKPYLDYAEKHRLANLLNISERHVKQWFANTRAKEKNMRIYKRLTKSQRKILMKDFEKNPYLKSVRRKKLAISLNITESSISSWFCKAREIKQRMAFHQTITKGQKQILLDSFQANHHLSDAETCRLAKLLKTTKGTIRYLFAKARERKKIMSFQREST